MNAKISSLAGWAILVLMLCQFVPLERQNPPVATPGDIPPDVLGILDRHCGQCHSNTTRWPRSAYLAPLSWYVVNKVHVARKAMNLSVPEAVSGSEKLPWKSRMRDLILSDELRRHAMVPGFQSPELTTTERQRLLDWSSATEKTPRTMTDDSSGQHR